MKVNNNIIASCTGRIIFCSDNAADQNVGFARQSAQGANLFIRVSAGADYGFRIVSATRWDQYGANIMSNPILQLQGMYTASSSTAGTQNWSLSNARVYFYGLKLI